MPLPLTGPNAGTVSGNGGGVVYFSPEVLDIFAASGTGPEIRFNIGIPFVLGSQLEDSTSTLNVIASVTYYYSAPEPAAGAILGLGAALLFHVRSRQRRSGTGPSCRLAP